MLGPLEISGAERLRVPPGRQQVVLAALLLELGRVVSTDALVDALWVSDPPETARTQVQICVSRLRKLLRPLGAVIDTRSPGYLLRAEPGTVDVHLFRSAVRDAEILVKEGRTEDAAACLREAVGLWRGPALSGIDAEVLRTKAVRLDEDRVDAIETHLELELGLGLHARLAGEIPSLVEQYPLRERLRSLLMLALYRSGRQAEALRVYRSGRDLFIEELGLEPGAELRSLEAAILNGDPSLDAPGPDTSAVRGPDAADRGRSAPPDGADGGNDPEPGSAPSVRAGTALFQLPTAAGDFVGRRDTVSAVTGVLLSGTDSVGIAVLLGRPGVGKSATAVHIAHRLADEHFPDGQLYCDLRGMHDTPLTASGVLGRFLRALGVHGPAVPDDLDERAALYRGLMASRRILVVLEDAATEAQIAPLIPAGGGCGVLVTSRARLTGLPGAVRIDLDILEEEHALELLARVIGADRVTREPEAARVLVRSVGRLPLALRIVAARLAARPHWALAAMVTRLSDERHRLDELAHGDMTVRASLSLTYDGLDQRSARVFGLLSGAEGPTVPAWSAAALLDDGRPFPADLAEPLVDARMLDVTGIDQAGEPVYRFHDLVREYAREKARDAGILGPQEIRRLVGGWLFLLEEANVRVVGSNLLRVRGEGMRWRPPEAYTERLLADPHRWIDGERANLLAAIAQAARSGLHEECWELASLFGVYAERRGYFDEFSEVLQVAASAVRTAGDRRGTAAVDFATSLLMSNDRRTDEAEAALSASFDGFAGIGDRLGQGLCRAWMADSAYSRGDAESARGLCEGALADFGAAGEPTAVWRPLVLLGRMYVEQGAYGDGTAYLERALRCTETAGDPRAQAQVLYQMARRDMALAEHRRARERYLRALELIAHPGDPVGEALLRFGLGRAQAALGQSGPARVSMGRSMELWEQLGDREGVEQVRAALEGLPADSGAVVTVSGHHGS
ncbi:AfsR/SARP family transcriptional regulator [Nocardiopsis sp. CNT312]|uniref:AfsR/SARP family transcriptional regulator n=1 Tax=Nocardiopsis sp. CNT312 TaxID=1137268 RepID=UPI0004AFFEEE|nr:AfsR/SARP family transcriptional regulator [Nocardiopsis sp. CNT312]